MYEITFGGQKYDFIIKDLGKGRHNVECGQRQGGQGGQSDRGDVHNNPRRLNHDK